MSRRPSAFAMLSQNFRRSWAVARHDYFAKNVYVGSDEEGNKYYEKKGNADGTIKNKRWVEAVNPDQTRVPRVPMNWDAWLRGRRDDTPTAAEVASIEHRLERSKAQAMEKQAKKSDEGETIFGKTQENVPFPKYDDLQSKPFGRHKPDN